MRILSGVQSSGRLHIGNYYGAIRQFVQLQDEGEALYFIANYHSLTTVRDPKLAEELTREAALAYLSLGLDPKKAVLFRQSDVREVLELYWILGTVVPMANLERAHSYKDKIDRGISPDFGLFAYPVLMAADILLYGADVVPVGKDQIQHIEFARDWAIKFNMTYVPGYDPQDPEGKEKGHAPGILKLPAARVQESTADGAGRGRAEDVQVLRQHHRALRRREGDQEAHHGHQDGLHARRGPQAHRERAPVRSAQADAARAALPGGGCHLARGWQGLRRLQEAAARGLPRDLRSGAQARTRSSSAIPPSSSASSRMAPSGPVPRPPSSCSGSAAPWAFPERVKDVW